MSSPVPRARPTADALRALTAERARDAAAMLARCRAARSRGSEAVLALSDARTRLDEATRALAATVHALGVPSGEAVDALTAALAADGGAGGALSGAPPGAGGILAAGRRR
jgi:hypothetical protein